MEANTLKARIAGWLTATRDVETPLGLDAHEARTRAQALLGEIREVKLTPEQVSLDDDLKQVLSVLVSLLAESKQPSDSRLKEADAVYQFIRRLPWPSDPFGEQQDLLRECAEIGWGAIGLSLADIESRRNAIGGPLSDIPGTRDAITRREAGEVYNTDLTPMTPVIETADAMSVAKFYLDAADDSRDASVARDPDVLMAICSLFHAEKDSAPKKVSDESQALHRILTSETVVGLFDEREYFLGETSLLAGTALRHLGKYDDAERWFSRAEAAFREILNPAPCLANVSYARLTLRYAMARYDDVLEFIPSLARSFDKLGMHAESAKARLLEAMALKLVGKAQESCAALRALRESAVGEGSVYGQVLVELGEHHASEGRHEQSMTFYREALQVLEKTGSAIGLAHLRGVVAEGLRLQGKLPSALEAYRAAQSSFRELGMTKYVSYTHVLIAEVLIAMNRHREAECEILAALPTIEEQKMVPEGFAAVALLKESVRRRKTDPNALRELREHLQKQK